MKLVIGDKTYSSWSLRPWLALKHADIPFTEINVNLYGPKKSDLSRFSPTALVPVLHHGDFMVWDTLAICEYLADTFPDKALWPAEPHARALARAAAAEMHSGFAALRTEAPFDLSKRSETALSERAQVNVKRIVTLFKTLRSRFAGDGPFLAGTWSIADAFFTPVAVRFRGHGVDPAAFGDDGTTAAYCEALLAAPEFRAWEADAGRERDGARH